MSGKNSIGFLLDSSYFYIHTSNSADVARFGNTDGIASIRLYTKNDSNYGYAIDVIENPNTLYQDLRVHSYGNNVSSLFIEGRSGNVGINTDHPLHTLDVKGDLFLEGQLYQKGSNIVIISETIQSSLIYANEIYSCNAVNRISFTNNTLYDIVSIDAHENIVVGNTLFSSNLEVYNSAHFWQNSNITLSVKNNGNVGVGTNSPLSRLHVQGMLRLDGEPFLHVMGGMQRFQVSVGNTWIGTVGAKKYGFLVSWTGTNLTEEDMIEVAGSCSAFGANGIRISHRFAIFVNPRLGTLDAIVDQNSLNSTNVSKPMLKVERKTANAIEIYVEWSATQAGYRAQMKLDMFAPVTVGNVNAIGFLRDG